MSIIPFLKGRESKNKVKREFKNLKNPPARKIMHPTWFDVKHSAPANYQGQAPGYNRLLEKHIGFFVYGRFGRESFKKC
jgi:hypothetical protein